MSNAIAEVKLRIRCPSFKACVYRQWRDWKTGLLMETVEPAADYPREQYWPYQPVVLFYSRRDDVVFCDPLDEALKMDARYIDTQIIRLPRYQELKDRPPDILELLRQNQEARQLYPTWPL